MRQDQGRFKPGDIISDQERSVIMRKLGASIKVIYDETPGY